MMVQSLSAPMLLGLFGLAAGFASGSSGASAQPTLVVVPVTVPSAAADASESPWNDEMIESCRLVLGHTSEPAETVSSPAMLNNTIVLAAGDTAGGYTVSLECSDPA
eukprot:SAG22_NODE_5741_length_961_cov_1.587007_1_plen_106_part_10